MTKDYSVEYAHIYTNQRVSEEHKTSIEVLSEVSTELESNSSSSALVVMVDDYSFPDPTFDYSEFYAWLAEQGFKPDLIIRESQLIPLCDEVLGIMEHGLLREQITDYVKAKKYPCSLFIASWYLLRLGKLEAPFYPEDIRASGLINILPESFKPFEDKGLEIISATKYAECVDFIKYRFMPGRMIA